MRNFPTQFWKRFQDFKDASAIYTVEDGSRQTLTFWEWTRRIQNIAVALLEEGFEPETRMGFVAPNCRDWLDMAVAAWLVGGCVVPLIPGRDRRETLRCLGRSGCDWIVVADDAERGRLRGPGGQLPAHLKWVFFDGDAPGETTFSVADLEDSGRALLRRGRTRQLAERIYGLSAEAPTLILFDPHPDEDAQGAYFSGKKLAYHLEAIAHQMGMGNDDKVVVASALSFGWFSSFLITLAALHAGRAVALSTTLTDLSDEVKSLRPTHLVCGPAYLEKLAGRWKDRLENAPDLLRRFAGTDEKESDGTDLLGTLGALGSLGERTARRFLYDPIRDEFGGRLRVISVIEGRCPEGLHDILDKAGVALLGHFGVPEAGISHIEHPNVRRPNSAGRPIEGVATKIDGAKSGEVGELCLRGDHLFDGYWAGEGPRRVDEEGWLHTGRQARLDSAFLFLEDQ